MQRFVTSWNHHTHGGISTVRNNFKLSFYRFRFEALAVATLPAPLPLDPPTAFCLLFKGGRLSCVLRFRLVDFEGVLATAFEPRSDTCAAPLRDFS